MAENKRVAIVGAGISGIVSVKSCLEEGLEPVCYEQFDKHGGLWYYTEKYREGQGARAFDHLTSNVCKDMFAFSDFPPSEDCPTYLTCSSAIKYINAYCDKFNLNKHIHLNTKVTKVRKSHDYDVTGKWEVETEDKTGVHREVFDFVIIGSGFYMKGRYPDVEGLDTFKGSIGHSQNYKEGSKYKGQRVLVVGNSSSAGDLTAGAAYYADQTYFSVGRGAYLMPRYGTKGMPWEYNVMRRSNFTTMAKGNKFMYDYCFNSFDLRTAGLSPSSPPLQSRLIVNDEIQVQILNGKVKVVGQLVRIGPHEAEFEDGTVLENLDAILLATGYDFSCDFMDVDLMDGRSWGPFHEALAALRYQQNKMTLYKMMFPLQLPLNTLALVGIVAIDGSVPPVCELQARLITRVFAGNHSLPTRTAMTADVDKWNKFVLENYGRYRYLMPYLPYKDDLAAELGCAPSWLDLIKAGPSVAYLYKYGPAFPYHYRLWGPHSWLGAKEAIENAMEHGYCTRQPRAAPACNF